MQARAVLLSVTISAEIHRLYDNISSVAFARPIFVDGCELCGVDKCSVVIVVPVVDTAIAEKKARVFLLGFSLVQFISRFN